MRMLSKELILSILTTYFIYYIFNRTPYIEIEPTREEMANVDYHYSDGVYE